MGVHMCETTVLNIHAWTYARPTLYACTSAGLHVRTLVVLRGKLSTYGFHDMGTPGHTHGAHRTHHGDMHNVYNMDAEGEWRTSSPLNAHTWGITQHTHFCKEQCEQCPVVYVCGTLIIITEQGCNAGMVKHSVSREQQCVGDIEQCITWSDGRCCIQAPAIPWCGLWSQLVGGVITDGGWLTMRARDSTHTCVWDGSPCSFAHFKSSSACAGGSGLWCCCGGGGGQRQLTFVCNKYYKRTLMIVCCLLNYLCCLMAMKTGQTGHDIGVHSVEHVLLNNDACVSGKDMVLFDGFWWVYMAHETTSFVNYCCFVGRDEIYIKMTDDRLANVVHMLALLGLGKQTKITVCVCEGQWAIALNSKCRPPATHALTHGPEHPKDPSTPQRPLNKYHMPAIRCFYCVIVPAKSHP